MGKKSTPKGRSKDSKSTAEGSKTNAKLNATWNHEAHIKYRLSDKEFVTRGWTKLPEDVVIQKMTTYKTYSAKPHMLLFNRRRHSEHKYYPDGTRAAVFNANGTGSIYYPDGKIAIHCMNRTYIVLSPGGKDPLTGYIRAQVITALFDMLGNGVVYDNGGNVVINFTQRLGVFEGTQNGLPMKWSWPVKIKQDESVTVPECQKIYYLDESTKRGNDATPYQSSTEDLDEDPSQGVSVKTVKQVLESASEEEKRRKRKEKSKPNKEIHHSMPSLHASNLPENANNSHVTSKVVDFQAIEHQETSNELITDLQALPENLQGSSTNCFEVDISAYLNRIKAIKKKHSRSVCAPIKPILRRLNEHMSLRILDQANVSLTYSACGQIFRLELGVVIDPTEIVQINKVVMKDTISVDGVVNYFEQFPNKALEKVLNRLTRQRDWSKERLRERLRIAKRCGGLV